MTSAPVGTAGGTGTTTGGGGGKAAGAGAVSAAVSRGAMAIAPAAKPRSPAVIFQRCIVSSGVR